MSLSGEEIDHMGPDELREALRRSLQSEGNYRARCAAEERKKDQAMHMVGSARIRIQSAQAIRHLARHYPEALGTNAEPNIDIALIDAIKDLDRADEIADCIPF